MASLNESFMVSLEETVLVKPPENLERKTIELSGMDRITPAMLYIVFFYKSCSEGCVGGERNIGEGGERNTGTGGERNHVADRIKKALERVLVSWYPAAGRLRLSEKTGKLEVDCNGEGVMMVTAHTEAKLEDLGVLHEYKPSYEKLVPQVQPSKDVSKNPLTVCQVTKFADGGFSLGFGSNHALSDGVGASNFLLSCAHIASGKDETLLSKPNHSRQRLMSIISPHGAAVNKTSIFTNPNISAIKDLCKIPMKAMASDDLSWEITLSEMCSQKSGVGLELITICVKQEAIEEWKKATGLPICSTFDVLCARIWKARAMALEFHPSTKICLQFPMNARNKLHPPLLENYAGNAFVLASVLSSAHELFQEPLWSIIVKIQAAKKEVGHEYAKSFATALESTEKFFPSMRELTLVSDWMKFPFLELDFEWGKPCGAVPLVTPAPETAFLMRGSSEVFVRIGLESQHVEAFMKNFYGSH